jgi:quercetin dioxygenase-like cupin family protein
VLTVQAVSFREDSKSDTMKLIHIASIEKGGSSMIRKSSECQVEYREHMRDGDGTVQLTNFITGPEELNGKGRLFSRITLNPGCSIGYHVHEGDAELFYILKGTAEYSDNGTVKQVTAGDVTICPDGEGHGIANRTDEVVELIAVIVYA